ncbi:MAG: SufD family Fe-S cluster assembly protein [Planctomycetes bacterium]|nr:SufD family Fe-S cluster assembly protein [Planctomycetota bacterium]
MVPSRGPCASVGATQSSLSRRPDASKSAAAILVPPRLTPTAVWFGGCMRCPARSRGEDTASYRGMVKVYPKARGCKVSVECDALLIDKDSRSDTYPTMEIGEDNVQIEHEARVSKVSEEQIFYLMSRGLTEDEARLLIVNGFIEPFTKELPMEYAVELNRLIELEMEGSVG